MELKFLVNDKPIKEIILKHLAGREFVSVGELNSHCAGLAGGIVTDIARPPDAHDNYLFFLSVVKTVRSLKEKGLVETKEIENHLWVKVVKNET